MPPDVPVCTELSPTKGYCVKIVSGKDFEVTEDKPFNGKTWWEQKPTMVMVPVSSYKELRNWIIKICKKNEKQCQKEVASWDRTLEVIDTNIVKDK